MSKACPWLEQGSNGERAVPLKAVKVDDFAKSH